MSSKTKEAAWLGPGAALFIARPTGCGHCARRREAPATRSAPTTPETRRLQPLSLAQIYESEFDFVWRCARRLGVATPHVDDVAQEVFLVVHRRLSEFEARCSLRTWLYAITRRVVSDHRRSARRKPSEPIGDRDPVADGCAVDEQLARQQDARIFYQLLEQLDDDKREVFVLSELEQLSGPEIAELLDENVNTVYARLRAARASFELAVSRHQARGRSGR